MNNIQGLTIAVGLWMQHSLRMINRLVRTHKKATPQSPKSLNNKTTTTTSATLMQGCYPFSAAGCEGGADGHTSGANAGEETYSSIP